MKQIQISDEELQRSRGNREIIEATIQQINKDFEYAGFETPVKEFSEYLELKKKLADAITKLLLNNRHRFISMLYRIDIPDNIIMYALDPVQIETPQNRFADIIIERELIKVLIKRYYKNNK